MKKTQYVSPIIGTVGDEQDTSLHGGGKTHPGACWPFGMVQLSPDNLTGGDNGTGYNFCKNTIEGFSFNHMSGIGWYGDLGNLQIMPIVGQTDLRSGTNVEVSFKHGTRGWHSSFDHNNETAQAGYYSVLLDRYNIFCEATVSCRTGQLRFTYPENKESGIIFNFSRRIAGRSNAQQIELDGNFVYGCITCDHTYGGFGRGRGGIDYKLYFALELSKPVHSARFFEHETFLPDNATRAEGEDLHLLVRFNTAENEPVFIRCGISYTDLEGAKNNLRAECPNFDFDGMRQQADSAWEQALSVVEVQGSSETDLTLFYTCLYHTLLDPRTAVDADGRFRGADGLIHTANYTHRTMFSGWDVYRSEFPLLTLTRPTAVNDVVNSLLHIALARNTSLPRWELMGIDSRCMVGDPGLLVMADAYLKGIRDFDVDTAYEICYASATAADTFREKPFTSLHPNQACYQEQAFFPAKLSHTLEFLLADFAIAKLANALGKDADHNHFLARTRTYPNNYNPAIGFMSPRNEDGTFLPVRNRYDTTGCVESNLYQQSFFVPYDIDGLAALFGRERFISLLEELFDRANFSALWNEDYNHSNEPCHNQTHYFNVLGLPHRTDYWTRRVQKEAYRLGAFGFCGNEDVGQLSAWYVLSAMGFAQICLADDKYYLNTPLFQSATLCLDNRYHSRSVADTFTVSCDNNPLEYPYIDGLSLNGTNLTRRWLTYSEITAGGTLTIHLRKEAQA